MKYEVDIALWRKVVNIDEFFYLNVISVESDKVLIDIYSTDRSNISESDKMFFHGVVCTINLLTNHKWSCLQDIEDTTNHLTFGISD